MSETPEEQPSTGVLGRIGSWFSPWRAKSPKSPSEHASPTSDEVFKSEGEEEESEESVRPRGRQQQKKEIQQISRDIFFGEGEDATQSAHRDGSAVSSTESAGGGPNEEEFFGWGENRTGQGKDREEGSNGTSESGNSKENASHLTHLSSSPEQGVLRDSDRAHTQPQAQRKAQAQTGKRLQVYLEETSVIHCGKDTNSGQEVITKVKTSLQVHPRAKSTKSFDLPKRANSTSAENKRTNVTPAVGAPSYYSALVGVSLKSQKDSELEAEPDHKQTEEDIMGRKNSAKRRLRKNSQGDGGSSPQQEKMPPNAVSEGFPSSDNTVTSAEGKSPNTNMGESSAHSSSKHHPSSQASPVGGEGETSCPDSVTKLDVFQDANSTVTEATAASVVDGGAVMEDDDSLYKVERKTETPESKRRSMKVSRSEVKFFTKSVALNSKQSPAGDTQDFSSRLNSFQDEAKDKVKTETDSRQHSLKKIDEEAKPVSGRIADRISLFERPAGGVSKLTSKAPRSADVSPIRKDIEELKVNFSSSDQRSRSVERYGTSRSSSASPAREKPVTIKERMKNLSEATKAGVKPALPLKPSMTRMPQKTTPSAASKSQELDNQGKQDTKQRMQIETKTEITSKPDGQDAADVEVKIFPPEEQATDSKRKDLEASKASDQCKKPNSVETSLPAKEPEDSKEPNMSLSPRSKGQNRTGSRSKRRKSKEPTSPMSPNIENKPDHFTAKSEIAALNPEQVDDAETASASKQPTEKDITRDKAKEKIPDKQSLPDTKHKAFKDDGEESDKQKKQVDSSFKKEKTDKPLEKQGGLSEPPVTKDEPDTAACSSKTKTLIDKGSVVLPHKEEKGGGLFTQEGRKASKDSKEMSSSFSPSSSPAPQKATQKTPAKEQESSVEHPKLNKDLSVQSEPKSQGKVKESSQEEAGQKDQSKNKNTTLTKQAESKDVGKLVKEDREIKKQAESRDTGKLEKVESKISKQAGRKEMDKSEKAERERTHQTEKKDKEKALLHLDKSTKKSELSEGGQGFQETDASVLRKGEGKMAERKDDTQLSQNTTKPESNQQEPASKSTEKTSSDIRIQTQHETQNKSSGSQKAGIGTHAKQAGSGIESDKEPSKAEMVTNVRKNSTESTGTKTEPVLTAADPKPNSVSVEKSENSLDDSCAHGANDAKLSSQKPITKAATAVKETTVKASNDTPALITAKADNMAATQTTLKKPTLITAPESVDSKRGRQDKAAKLASSEVNISGDNVKLSPSVQLHEASKNTESTRDITPLKGAGIKAEVSLNSTASKSTVNVVGMSAEKSILTPENELSLIMNGIINPYAPSTTVKKEQFNIKQSQTPKAPTSQEDKKPTKDSSQRSPMKKLHLPRGLSKDDSTASEQQDAPSSWLDVDFPKRKLKVSMPKLTHAGSESNLLDTPDDLDDDDFVERIKKLCAPFSLPPRKHNPFRPPQPPFAMPAIREDRFEKTFDPEEFKFGLRKKKQFSIDTTPSTLIKLQNTEEKSVPKPARVSLADRSLLLSSLDTHSRLREKSPLNEDEDLKEEKDDQIKWKSRLEGSCVLSSLTNSIHRGKRSGLQTHADGTSSGDVSPSDSPLPSPPLSSQPPPPSPTATAPLKDILAKQSNKEEAQAGEAVVSDSTPPFPSFNDIKLPDYLEKYLPREPKPVQSKQGQEQARTEATGKMTTPAPVVETDVAVKPGLVLPDAVPPRFPGIPPPSHSTLPELKQPLAHSQGILDNNIRTVKGFHKRPGKMVLFEKAQFSGQAFEIYRDVADATSLKLSPLISVKVVRGCWVLYEKPDFQGRCIALEEGGIELSDVWAEPAPGTEPQNGPPMLIGSIRLAVSDYSLPHIDLFTEPEGLGRVTPYHDDTIETGSFGIPLSTASIQVHSGVWLVFSDPGFQGMVAVLETGVYPFPETWGFQSPFVGSIRPLKIGGFKVENPSEVKAVVYESPGFEGSCLEIDSEVFSFSESEEDNPPDGVNSDSKKIKSVGSFKIIGGLWVGYSHPGFEGQQFILEEGEYMDCTDWGGPEQLLSLRPIQADFLSPHLKMFSDRNFGDMGVNIDLTVPVINMDNTGYGMKTQSIDVMSGVWVVFEEPGFCGESYILEKGLYGSPEDWGAMQPRVAAAMPVVLDDFENAASFKVQLFSDPGFQGTVLTLEDSVTSLQDGFSVASCKVLAGSWLAFEGKDFSGKMYVLEVGSYPDLRAMGCFNASSSILSLQTVGFEFSLPSITVFERCALRGKRVVLTDGSVNLQLAGGCSRVQSVLVEGGIWVLYEEINYRGAQVLLKPGEISDWHQFCSWRKIGSLRPLLQKKVHFRIRNRKTRLMMSLTGDLDDVKMMRIQEMEDTDGFEQIWLYQNGHLHCKMLEECCLSPSGSMTMAGSRVGLTPEPQNHLWSITPEGFIRYSPTSDLVLEVKGGHNYDKNQVILNTLDPHKLHQRWDVEII
ncbi:beta/gamma crystallin domain-containing protein 1-like [Notolabrus celidotus]|uniref:beta/gamma crystallin domain-containing protein 1-like n=1 Tax=Notolabrus celidotus TaxID=1203425 RepID=UPI0014902720|nr:beta/gamma crystallin domain-containing protein 1-like [Notolabrus celidotus]